MKTCSVSADVYHRWANQIEPGEGARSKNGNYEFCGNVARYQGRIVGVIAQRANTAAKAYLVRPYNDPVSRNWGNRGAAEYHVRSAIPKSDDAPIFEWLTIRHLYSVDNGVLSERQIKTEIEHRLGLINSLLAEARNQRTRAYGTLKQAQGEIEEVRKIAEFFDYCLPELPISDTNLEGLIRLAYEKMCRLYAQQAEARTQRLGNWKEKQERDFAAMRACVPEWLRGENPGLNIYLLPESYLRPRDNLRVETSKGAVVMRERIEQLAPQILRLINMCRSKQEDYRFAGTFIDGYAVRGIDSRGALYIGCHKFEPEEILRFGKSIGVYDEQQTLSPIGEKEG